MMETKAYDLDVLVERLKAKGLIQAEKTLLEILNELDLWAKESATLGQKGFVDMAVMALSPIAKPMLKDLIDKIDGEVNL